MNIIHTARYATIIAFFLISCGGPGDGADATGTFEADEVIVSAEGSGRLLSVKIKEGQSYKAGEVVGIIDTTQLYLRRRQTQYSIQSVLARMPDMRVQLATIEEQLKVARKEKARVENLLKSGAVSQKQMDDMTSQVDVLQRQYDALQSSLQTTNRTLQSETLPLKAQLAQIEDQLAKSRVTNPVDGTVLVQYTLENEVVNPGKALYKIANLANVTLRAYVSGGQLSTIKLGQSVTVRVDSGTDTYKNYTGTISWIADKAEFTPKTIQTKDERANLVYAIKISVPNDGLLKLGMYGEVLFK
ncbi:MAG: HlyD family efflux transporter periplasmic adaptor subunit [Cyclobacteriaceae bacterium]|nr:HlyD family efflux transporter periplasmic adaptor subunit [Cyclobacteriaceae bacterium]